MIARLHGCRKGSTADNHVQPSLIVEAALTDFVNRGRQNRGEAAAVKTHVEYDPLNIAVGHHWLQLREEIRRGLLGILHAAVVLEVECRSVIDKGGPVI